MRRFQLASDELVAQTPLKEIELDAQTQLKDIEIQTQLKQREIEAHERVELEKLKIQREQIIVERKNVVGIDKEAENAKKAVPKFSEPADIDSYLTLFEKNGKFQN